MSNQARQRELGAAQEFVLSARAGAERYGRRQREARSGGARSTDGARPLEFDKSGFPIPQRNPGFVERVARLLNPI
jgi:hypothetical protein